MSLRWRVGDLTHYDYGFRIYNPGIGKFLSVDPLAPDYPWYTPYQFAGNKPIVAIDIDGLEEFSIHSKVEADDFKRALCGTIDADELLYQIEFFESFHRNKNGPKYPVVAARDFDWKGGNVISRLDNPDIISVTGYHEIDGVVDQWKISFNRKSAIQKLVLEPGTRFKSTFEQMIGQNQDEEAMALLFDAFGSLAGSGLALAFKDGDSSLGGAQTAIDNPDFVAPGWWTVLNNFLKDGDPQSDNSNPVQQEIKDVRVEWNSTQSIVTPANGVIDTGSIIQSDGNTRDTFRQNTNTEETKNFPNGSSETTTTPNWGPVKQNKGG